MAAADEEDVMTKVIADITMSLDGFVTGPDAGPDAGLGVGGEPLHAWVFGDDPVDAEILQRAMDETGAVVMGRNLFDVVDGPDGWNDDMGYGAGHAGRPPFVVVTHSAPQQVRLNLDFTFVGDGVAAAVDQARSKAGDKDVFVMGGGDVVRQCVDSGVADELRIHLSPILLGAGTPLFTGGPRREMVQRSVRVSKHATHLVYDVG
jgi:dihydrofolate reductase